MRSLIRRVQLHPDISGAVGQYGSGFFLPLTTVLSNGGVDITGVASFLSTGNYELNNSTYAAGIKNQEDGTLVLEYNTAGDGWGGRVARGQTDDSSPLITFDFFNKTGSSFVKLTGTQTILGSKEFQGNVSFNDLPNGTNALFFSPDDGLYLYGSEGNYSLSAYGRILVDSNGVQALNWNDKLLQDNDEIQSVNWAFRTLQSSNGSITVDWENQSLIDPSVGSEVFGWKPDADGGLNCNTNLLINVGDAVNDQDAINKLYLTKYVSGYSGYAAKNYLTSGTTGVFASAATIAALSGSITGVTAKYNKVSFSSFFPYVYTGLVQNEIYIEDNFMATGWKVGCQTTGNSVVPLSGDFYQRRPTGPTTSKICPFSLAGLTYFNQRTEPNTLVTGGGYVGFNILSGLSGVQNVTFTLIGYLT